jgi:phage/conjugal plasmid C-4 type zinc finger TraR family protein
VNNLRNRVLFMASGWARDGAVQDQIDASVEDAVKEAQSNINTGESAEFCEECESPIPELRRSAIPGVQLCVSCQSALESEKANTSGINRRASKDSQLR